MRNELYADRLCKSDFENYDLKSIEKCDEPFLWAIRPTGTSLQFIGASCMTEAFGKEQCRMELFRDNLAPIACITFSWSSSMKYFYWDGLSLVRIQKDEAKDIFLNLWSAEIKRQEIQHKDEYDVCNKPLTIEICCNPLRQEEALKKANDLEDTSLVDCLERLTRWTRQAVEHKVELYSDFADYSFTFCEKVNGEPRLFGGIIYSESASDGKHWSMHT